RSAPEFRVFPEFPDVDHPALDDQSAIPCLANLGENILPVLVIDPKEGSAEFHDSTRRKRQQNLRDMAGSAYRNLRLTKGTVRDSHRRKQQVDVAADIR